MLPRQPQPLYELAGGYRQQAPSSSSSVLLLAKAAPDRPHHHHFAPEALQPAAASSSGKSEACAAEQQQMRRKINSRERKRMQDLNLAMDALREVIVPYSAAHCHSSPGRKLSKIATLLLARNYILSLGTSLQELRRLIGDMTGGGAPRLLLAGLPLFAAAGPSPVLLAPHHQHPHHPPDSLRAAAGKYLALALEEQQQHCGLAAGHLSGGSLCPCALCKFPHCLPAGLGVAAVPASFSK